MEKEGVKKAGGEAEVVGVLGMFCDNISCEI